MKRLLIILVGGLALLAAYTMTRNAQDAGQAQANVEESAQPREEDSSLFSTQIKAIDKAKGVESTIMNAFNKRDSQMDAQGQ